MNDKRIHIEFFSSGYCTANSRHVFPDDPRKVIPFHATWAFIDHPSLGKILFDTGYSSRFFKATKSLPNRIYRLITPVYHEAEQSCISQLRRMNITAAGIKNIVISHFHADHTGGLMDFPEAGVWCSEEALEFALGKHRLTAVFKGVLKEQIPEGIRSRANFPRGLLEEFELFGLKMWKWAENISFVDLPGHARGQIGLYVRNTIYGDLLLCADAAWSSESVRSKIYPSGIVSVISDNFKEMKKTMDKLHNLSVSNPEIKIIPTHCHETVILSKTGIEVQT
ncbi:MAG: MBL fold metallo-hydrolase [Bacteroidales bacterium]|nr:MBL fold metallo-hydrolase [Bacteroidales bacterium]